MVATGETIMYPFNLPGPEFLGFYVIVFGVAVILALIVRELLRVPAGTPVPGSLDLSAYEVAFLAGGESHAVNVALANMIHRELLAVNVSRRTVSRRDDLPSGAPALEHILHSAA